MNIREVKMTDKSEWARMRDSLWPGSPSEHPEEIDRFFSNDHQHMVQAYVLERNSGKLGGFIELNVRNYAEGTASSKVPYIEGWYVDEDLRGRGYGKKLLATAEAWALERGFDEVASDTDPANKTSIAVHEALGFKEVDRKVCFLKKLRRLHPRKNA
jgi:aminoglycoside 6'-N-acetyltransferase I